MLSHGYSEGVLIRCFLTVDIRRIYKGQSAAKPQGDIRMLRIMQCRNTLIGRWDSRRCAATAKRLQLFPMRVDINSPVEEPLHYRDVIPKGSSLSVVLMML
jgi:hypothetical protein